jgi:predicted AAA+ superfamily ATPase
MVVRLLFNQIAERLNKGKAIIIIGPRQVGKTTLLDLLAKKINKPYLFINCDEPDSRNRLHDITSTELKNWIGNNEYVLIDEAQRVKNIGITLKLIIDTIKTTQLIVSGSSAFELSNEINEPLTGRKFEFILLPLSAEEMLAHNGLQEENRMLEHRLIYGFYPDVINNPGKEQEMLRWLCGSYLYKDIFSFQQIRKPELIEKLLQALALQIGSEVSYNELAKTVQSDPLTVQRYIELLEKTYVIFRLPALSRNVRTELKKSRKIYFYDNGIRNALISDFKSFPLRVDKGALWENYLISERTKLIQNHLLLSNRYFWRTQQQQEIDYIEDRDGELYAWEFKWNSTKKVHFPITFTQNYPNTHTQVINSGNMWEFVSLPQK